MKTETKNTTHAERRKLEGGDLIEAEERLSVAGKNTQHSVSKKTGNEALTLKASLVWFSVILNIFTKRSQQTAVQFQDI